MMKQETKKPAVHSADDTAIITTTFNPLTGYFKETERLNVLMNGGDPRA